MSVIRPDTDDGDARAIYNTLAAMPDRASSEEIERQLQRLIAADMYGYYIYTYASIVARRRIPVVERRLIEVDEVGKYMYFYAADLNTGRIPEFEEVMAKRAKASWLLYYANNVARCRMREFEPRIFVLASEDAHIASSYLNNYVKQRVPELERSQVAVRYSKL